MGPHGLPIFVQWLTVQMYPFLAEERATEEICTWNEPHYQFVQEEAFCEMEKLTAVIKIATRSTN